MDDLVRDLGLAVRGSAALGLGVILLSCRTSSRGATSAPASPPSVAAANTPVERANACRQIAGQLPDTSVGDDTVALASWRRAFARGAAYRCVIHPAIPAVRVVISGDSSAGALDSLVVLPDAPGAPPADWLVIESEIPPPWSTDVVRMLDLDADGYNDLLVGNIWGATGNTSYVVWRFDPRRRRFVEDRELSALFGPKPVPGAACVDTHAHLSVAESTDERLCLRKGHWVTDSLVADTWDRTAHVVVREVRARRGDSLVVVRRTVRPDSMP